MIDPIWLIAGGWVAGAPLPKLSLLAGALYFPWICLPVVVIGIMVVRVRPASASTGSIPIEVGAQLRAGRSLRQAVASVSNSQVGRLAQAGRPLDQVMASFPAATEEQMMAAVAVRMADRSGGRSADIFDALGIAALENEAIRREQKAATAPALLAASIVGGMPAIYVIWLTWSGQLTHIISGGGPVAMLTITGAGLVVFGVGAVLLQAKAGQQ